MLLPVLDEKQCHNVLATKTKVKISLTYALVYITQSQKFKMDMRHCV